ncbi:MAG: hypothetical protein ACOYT4_04385 [Nanoarchaeota archaeon]
MDYGCPDRRKTKKDLKRKRTFRVYKKGGALRAVKIEEKEDKKK